MNDTFRYKNTPIKTNIHPNYATIYPQHFNPHEYNCIWYRSKFRILMFSILTRRMTEFIFIENQKKKKNT